MNMRETMKPVIVSGFRTPIGKYNGVFKNCSSAQLGGLTIKNILNKTGIDPRNVDSVIMGNVLSAGLGQNVAKQAAISAGFPFDIDAFQVNMVCGSSLKTIQIGAQMIKSGDADVIIAGGLESMTNSPYLIKKDDYHDKSKESNVIDSMISDGLWDVYNDFHMGMTGEMIAERYNITRKECDLFSLQSHQKANRATKAGKFLKEIVKIEIPSPDGSVVSIDKDQGIREDSSLEKLSTLKPIFKPEGVLTAGNSSQISDGAAAVMIMSAEKAKSLGLEPLVSIRGYRSDGIEADRIMEAPIINVQRLLKDLTMSFDTIDLIEHNEAFSSSTLAFMKEFELDEKIVNVNGGAVALGHPIGATGARIIVTLIHAMQDRDVRMGLATLCIGGGNALSMVLDREI